MKDSAVSQAEFIAVQTQLESEWFKVGGVLMGFVGVESAFFALTPDWLLPPTNITRVAIALSSIATATGLLSDAYLLLRFSRASMETFKQRAEDGYGIDAPTYIAFAVLARLPLFLALLTMVCIIVLLGTAAYSISPSAVPVVGVVGVVGVVLVLRYLLLAILWVGFALSWVLALIATVCTYVMRRVRAVFPG
ncbi:hypothetical protein GGX14DRAFT_575982 [Mycena pura]|uniref:Uncharacterized protein n=1 Tax=Mycena pura TaxID=153505 RepID=A0AAD6UUT9_9AGAR|nr:hypothetical protein GGX14DRAFT_575982 [Mycena pura]